MSNFTMSKAFSNYIVDRSESVFKEKELRQLIVRKLLQRIIVKQSEVEQ